MITSLGITGFSGRMGQAIAETILSHAEACLAGGIVRNHIPTPCIAAPEKDHLITNDPSHLFPKCDAVIDFSHASATAHFATQAAAHGKPFFCGTTGLSEETVGELRGISQQVPVLYAANTSLSLIVTKKLAALAAQLLKGHDYDVSIFDKHHRWKKDAPSGTALTLGAAITEATSDKTTPAYASIRAGSIVGIHEILFAGQGETIKIEHQVTDRRVFARGAVEGALWLAKQPAGFYTMDDVLSVTP